MIHSKERLPPGLYFVGTPIGAARDITLRALDVLASADVLAAEDTRSLRKLLSIHGVPLAGRRVLSYHDHSPPSARERLVSAMSRGLSVAYASEAGMPTVSDPGYGLGRAASEAGHVVTCAPGPSALTSAMAVGGLPTDAVLFAGFLPSGARKRRSRLEELRDVPATIAVFESPHRVAACLRDMAAVLGPDREVAICRELTKRHEEVRRGELGAIAKSVSEAASAPRGEIVILAGRKATKTGTDSNGPTDNASTRLGERGLDDALGEALESKSVRDAADLVARELGLARRDVYQRALALTRGSD